MTKASRSSGVRAWRVLLGTIVLCWLPSQVSAYWFQDGIEWHVWPSGSSVGDCFANCGAGCSDHVNPCGGPAQYWDLVIIAGPGLFQSGWEATECVDGQFFIREWHEYHAIGTWTYHGWVKPGCITHDYYCNQWLIGCVLFFGCGDPGWTDTWSYDEWMRGYTTTPYEFGGWC